MYFATTTILCIASRTPFVVAVSLIVCSVFLEALQGLTPDRFPDFIAALAGMAGVISAATLVMLWNSANASFPCTMDGEDPRRRLQGRRRQRTDTCLCAPAASRS